MFKINDFNILLRNFNENKNSHSYIFYTNDFFACQNDVNNLVKSIFNIDNLNLLSTDYIVIEKSDNKNILKDDIVKIKDMFQNTSYINKKRIYLIEEAHKLNSTSANIILKFLEEPLGGVVAFFITTNLDAVLSTIKSRCQIINCFYKNTNMNMNEDVSVLEKLLFQDKYISLWTSKKIFEQYDRNMLIDLFNKYLIKCYNNVAVNSNLNIIKLLNKAISMLNNNVNIDYVLDYLFLEGSDK